MSAPTQSVLNTRIPTVLRKRAVAASKTAGLKLSDLTRNGLTRVCEEIEKTGSLLVAASTPAKKKGAASK